MKLPKHLEEKMNELADMLCGAQADGSFKEAIRVTSCYSFQSCAEILLPEIEKLKSENKQLQSKHDMLADVKASLAQQVFEQYLKYDSLKAEIEKLKSDMNLVVSSAGKDLIAERDRLKAENENHKTSNRRLANHNYDLKLEADKLAEAIEEIQKVVGTSTLQWHIAAKALQAYREKMESK